jgi:hypothetical protein
MVVNCCQCSYKQALGTEANLDSVLKQRMIDAFHKGWIRVGTEKAVDFSSYVSMDNELVISNISGIDERYNDSEGWQEH